MPHFYRSDLIALAVAFLLGIPIILIPGYALGWSLDLLGFKTQPATARWSVATVLGISTMPTVLYLPFKLASVNCMWVVLALLCGTACWQLFRRDSIPRWKDVSLAAKVAIAGWIIIGSLAILDIAKGNKLYPSAVIIDQSFRSQVIASLAHSNHLPPQSFFYYPGHPLHLRYHYLLFLLGATIERLGAGLVSPSIALTALTLWVGLGLLGLVAVFIRFFESIADKERAVRITWILLAVGGLDILPVGSSVLSHLLAHDPTTIPFPDIEWWNGWAQIFGWIDTALWQPHHLAALIGCVTGCLLLWNGRDLTGFRRWIPPLGAGLAFSSASGASIYVTVVFAIFLLIVIIEVLLNCSRRLPPLLISGCFACLLTYPFLLELTGKLDPNPTPLPFGFSIRPFQPLSATLITLHVKSIWVWNIGSLLALPVNYLLELGIFFVGGAWWLISARERKTSPRSEHLFIGVAIVSLLLVTFVWSGTETSNDFGYRGTLGCQFVLLICTTRMILWLWPKADAECPSKKWWRRIVFACVVIGLFTNLAGLLMLRSIGFSDAGVAFRIGALRGGNPAEKLADMRAAYSWVRLHSDANAVIQENPEFSFALMLGQYSDRRTAAYAPTLISTFVSSDNIRSDRAAFDDAIVGIRSLFLGPKNYDEASMICSKTGISYLVVQDSDPVWADRRSYVWHATPSFATTHVRVIEFRRSAPAHAASQGTATLCNQAGWRECQE